MRNYLRLLARICKQQHNVRDVIKLLTNRNHEVAFSKQKIKNEVTKSNVYLIKNQNRKCK